MKNKILLLLLIFSTISIFGQVAKKDDTCQEFIYKTSSSKGKAHTVAYHRNSVKFNKTLKYTECVIDANLMTLKQSIIDSIKTLLPRKTVALESEKILIYVVCQPNTKGKFVDVWLGWYEDKGLFPTSELRLIRNSLLKLSVAIKGECPAPSPSLCQPLTIAIYPKDWKE